jgi:hypothetical protein
MAVDQHVVAAAMNDKSWPKESTKEMTHGDTGQNEKKQH